MRAEIHPQYETINVNCSCGNSFETKSTMAAKSKDVHIDVCSKCHPFYTGTQKIVDTAGRVDLFKKKFAMFGEKKSDQNANKDTGN